MAFWAISRSWPRLLLGVRRSHLAFLRAGPRHRRPPAGREEHSGSWRPEPAGYAAGGSVCGNSIGPERSALFVRLRQADVQLTELLRRDLAWRAHEQVAGLLVHWEQRHLAQVL